MSIEEKSSDWLDTRSTVMAGLGPAIHVFAAKKTWMPATSAAMTVATALSILVSAAANAQPAPPPPAVTVAPVVSQQVIDTGGFIGRITAIDKVDIVARVPGFIEERTF